MKTQATTLTLAVLMAGVTAGCATRYTLLSTPAASMTDLSFPEGYKATAIGAVEGKYCMGNDARSGNKDAYSIGLMDEAIHDAQTTSGAKYIQNATFFAEGKCVVVEGTGMK